MAEDKRHHISQDQDLSGMRGPGRGGMMMGGGGYRGTMPVVKPKNSWQTVLRLWGYLNRQKSGLILVWFLTIISSGLMLLGPLLIGRTIDQHIEQFDGSGLLVMCLVLFGIYIGAAFMTWCQGYVMAGITQRTVWEIRQDLFAKLQQLPLRFFDSKTHGELMSRTTNDVETVSQVLNQSVTQFISSFITVFGALGFMLYLNVWLTIATLITIPLVVIITGLIARFTRRFFSAQQKSLGELNGYIEETVTGQKVVKTFCREEASLGEFDKINTRLKKSGIKAQIFTTVIHPVMNVINNLNFAIIAGVGGWLVVTGGTSIGIVVSFINYSKHFSRPINELASLFNMIQSAIAGAERVFEVMDTPTEYTEEEEAEATKQEGAGSQDDGLLNSDSTIKEGEVVFSNVTFSYKEGEPVLRNVSLTASPGSTIALVGPTGAGKTTIVNLLTRFYEIDEGSITIDGQELHTYDKNKLRQQLGIVLQDAYLFSDTIRENIRYGRLDATDEEVEQAAKMANADSFISKLPDGYDTVLSAEGNSLSEGQRQLITIARAILADPTILILDEATSSIDTRTEMHIQEAMLSLMKGRTSFVIAHRLSTIREADLILVINNGEIIERGTHQDLIDQEGFYYGLYTSQFKRAS
jgi:ATP-binding cassette subfamily B protein